MQKKLKKVWTEKKEVMILRQNNQFPQINIFINGNKLKQRD